jgi:hypothetical protein
MFFGPQGGVSGNPPYSFIFRHLNPNLGPGFLRGSASRCRRCLASLLLTFLPDSISSQNQHVESAFHVAREYT